MAKFIAKSYFSSDYFGTFKEGRSLIADEDNAEVARLLKEGLIEPADKKVVKAKKPAKEVEAEAETPEVVEE